MQIIKEVCVDSYEDAALVESSGADRIELCSRLDLDGITPSNDLLLRVHSDLKIPIRVMVRPHGNGFIYNENHLNEMINTIKLCKSLNVDGIVIGCLNESNDLDYHQINYLADYAKPLKVIVHKAIDYSNSVLSSFKNLILNKNINGILTSGGAQFASDGLKTLKKMVDLAPENFEVICAGGITHENFDKIHLELNARFYHGRKLIKY